MAKSTTVQAMSDENKPISAETLSSTSQEQTTDTQGEFTAAVDELLDQLQHKFDTVSREMFGKFDDMARRLDELEASLSVARDAGTTSSPSTK